MIAILSLIISQLRMVTLYESILQFVRNKTTLPPDMCVKSFGVPYRIHINKVDNRLLTLLHQRAIVDLRAIFRDFSKKNPV